MGAVARLGPELPLAPCWFFAKILKVPGDAWGNWGRRKVPSPALDLEPTRAAQSQAQGPKSLTSYSPAQPLLKKHEPHFSGSGIQVVVTRVLRSAVMSAEAGRPEGVAGPGVPRQEHTGRAPPHRTL